MVLSIGGRTSTLVGLVWLLELIGVVAYLRVLHLPLISSAMQTMALSRFTKKVESMMERSRIPKVSLVSCSVERARHMRTMR